MPLRWWERPTNTKHWCSVISVLFDSLEACPSYRYKSCFCLCLVLKLTSWNNGKKIMLKFIGIKNVLPLHNLWSSTLDNSTHKQATVLHRVYLMENTIWNYFYCFSSFKVFNYEIFIHSDLNPSLPPQFYSYDSFLMTILTVISIQK